MVYRRKYPTKKYAKRKPSKKTYRRRRRRYTNKSTKGAFPQHYNAILPYCYNTQVTTALVSGNDYVNGSAILLNGLYDTDYSNIWGNRQPPGFDELAALYGRYRVLAAKVKMTIVNKNSNAPVRFIMYPNKNNSLSALTTTPCRELALQPGSSKLITISNSDSSNKYVTSRYFTIAKSMGTLKQTVIGNDDYSAATNANPGELSYLWLVFDSNGVACTLDVTIEIKFYTRWERLRIDLDS